MQGRHIPEAPASLTSGWCRVVYSLLPIANAFLAASGAAFAHLSAGFTSCDMRCHQHYTPEDASQPCCRVHWLLDFLSPWGRKQTWIQITGLVLKKMKTM